MKWWFTVRRHSLDKSLRWMYQIILVRFKIKSIECHLAMKRICFLSKTTLWLLHSPWEWHPAVILHVLTSACVVITLQTQVSPCRCRRAAWVGGWSDLCCVSRGTGTETGLLAASRRGALLPGCCFGGSAPSFAGAGDLNAPRLVPCASDSYRDGEVGCPAEKHVLFWTHSWSARLLCSRVWKRGCKGNGVLLQEDCNFTLKTWWYLDAEGELSFC